MSARTSLHAAVVAIATPDDPLAIAEAAAAASLDLLWKVKIPDGKALLIESVSIVEPVPVSDYKNLLLGRVVSLGSVPKQAVVVTARLQPSVKAEAADAKASGT